MQSSPFTCLSGRSVAEPVAYAREEDAGFAGVRSAEHNLKTRGKRGALPAL